MQLWILLLSLIFTTNHSVAGAQKTSRLSEGESKKNTSEIVEHIEVDSVWAANRVVFALHTVGQRQFVAYYDRNRMMAVASRDINSHQWQKTILPSRLMWDSHNYVALGIDEQGFIHVSGNMHTHPLSYFRSEKTYDVSHMVELNEMVGQDEQSVTYPKFFYDNMGRLLFSYRSGTCGNGNILVNRYQPENGQWVRHLATPLFEGAQENDKRAAYHTYTKDSEGNFHFVWMWRWTPMVETCHQLCYATSPDLIHWKNAAGKRVSLPFRPDNEQVIVDHTPSKGGMHNSRYQIILTKNGNPVIGYVKYDEKGLTQLYLARFKGEQWVSKKISDWDFRWKFIGGGDRMTEGGHFRLAGISEDGFIVVRWGTEKGESGQYTLDPETLEHVETTAKIERKYPDDIYERLSDVRGLSVNLSDDRGGTQEKGVRYVLKWESKAPSHGKHAPKIIPEGPVSALVVLKIR